jgi:hypothetical protein
MNVTSVVSDRLVGAHTVRRKTTRRKIALVMEAASFSEMFAPLYQAIRRHIKQHLYYNSIIILVGGAGIV